MSNNILKEAQDLLADQGHIWSGIADATWDEERGVILEARTVKPDDIATFQHSALVRKQKGILKANGYTQIILPEGGFGWQPPEPEIKPIEATAEDAKEPMKALSKFLGEDKSDLWRFADVENGWIHASTTARGINQSSASQKREARQLQRDAELLQRYGWRVQPIIDGVSRTGVHGRQEQATLGFSVKPPTVYEKAENIFQAFEAATKIAGVKRLVFQEGEKLVTTPYKAGPQWHELTSGNVRARLSHQGWVMHEYKQFGSTSHIEFEPPANCYRGQGEA